jgi:penicillin-binding protein 1C
VAVLQALRRLRSVGARAVGLCLALAVLLLASAQARALPEFAAVRDAWRSSEAWLLDRAGRVLYQLRVDPDVRRLEWVPLAAVSPALVADVLQAEDRRFWQHEGVDWRALAASAVRGLTGARVRGASTLAMQLAALLDPSLRPRAGRRTLAQKLGQIRAARALDRAWGKPAILEAYLNLVHWRGEAQGIGAASAALFGKTPAGLDGAEAALLAALLPAPNAAPGAVARRACVLAGAAEGDLPCERLRRLAESALGSGAARAVAPGLAPHLARRLLRAPGARVATTLDAGLQARVQDLLAAQLLDLQGRNARDGAALVVENATGEVLAYVGSAGRRSAAPGVDGVRARRQAGSTLKPFLYGLAFERAYLTPASLLDDSPVQLQTGAGLYVPQNYDREFRGLVSARTALAGSLNVPAVRTLILTGLEPFRDRLVALGYAGIREDGEYYGYALALGSAEVSLLEQVNAYRTLANGGVWSPLRVLRDPAEAGNAPVPTGLAAGPPRRALSAPASFLVAQVLSERAGRAVTFGLGGPLSTPFWSAVKTGTSKDMRDNWCIGFSDRYTVGVWVGNFEGDAMRGVSGVSGAAPAWLEILELLHPGRASLPPRPPEGVTAREVRFEGEVEPPRQEWFLAGTDVSLVALAGADRPPRIVSPPPGVTIALDPDIPPRHQQVPLRAEGDAAGLVWVLDDVPIGAADVAGTWPPRPGEHRLALVGADGLARDTVRFRVR